MQNDNFTYSEFTSNGEKVWYITIVDNLLMEIDLNNHKVKCLGKIPNTLNETGAYRNLVYINEKLYLIPFNTTSLCIYDINTKNFNFMDAFHHSWCIDNKRMKLYGRLVYGNELIMYGLNSTVYKYNILSNELKAYQITNSEVQKNDIFFMKHGFVIGDKLILPSSEKTILVEIDLSTDKIKYYKFELNVPNVICQLVLYENQSFYFVLFDKEWKIHIGVIDINGYFVKDYQVYMPNLKKIESDNPNNIPFVCGFVKRNKIVLLPGKQLDTYVIDIDKKCYRIHSELVTRINGKCPFNYFAIGHLENSYYYSIQYGQKRFVMIQEETLSVIEMELDYVLMEEKECIMTNKMIMELSPILYEKDKFLNLCEYLERIK